MSEVTSATESEADRLIRLLNLQPHPEGGYYRETFRDEAGGVRGYSTLIYFLLQKGQRSHWHRIDAAEVWHHYRGAPLELRIGRDVVLLGPALEDGQRPQAVVPPGVWQAATCLGDYVLVGCSVAPGFDFAAFELAPPDFQP